MGYREQNRHPPHSHKGRPRFSQVKKLLEEQGLVSYVLEDRTRVNADQMTSVGRVVTNSDGEQPQLRIDSQPKQQAAGESAADGRQADRSRAETSSGLPQPEQPDAPDAGQPLTPTLRTRYGRGDVNYGGLSFLSC